jgi:hypothetical protein
MSYLQLMNAPLPDMDKGIISVWFRDIRKGKPPGPKEWPSGLWTPGTNSMVPPDTVGMVGTGEYDQNVFYWDAYGMPISVFGIGLGLLGPAAVCIPTPPPFITNDMHMMLTFGMPKQSYDYYEWQIEEADVIEAVQYIPAVVLGPQWSAPDFPPPYAPWITDRGKFKPLMLKLAGGPTRKTDYVPQSFIGVDKNGYLTICLQTNIRGKDKQIYKGWAFQLDKMHEIWATLSYYDKPAELGLQAGQWVQVPGYWDGYEFEYTDISNEVMGAGPECFIIGGGPTVLDFFTIPPINDGAWHHLLFSFDISGSVSLERPSLPPGTSGALPPPIVSTNCKAWLALDDQNYSGGPLQHRFPMHDGFTLPILPGMGTDIVGFGPVTSATRSTLKLQPNEILPRNCWILPMRGNPKDQLLRFTSTAGIWEQESTQFIQKGDFNFFVWTGLIWPLFHSGNWQGSLDPPRPSTPDPATTFAPPTYNCSGFKIPVAQHPIGIPVTSHHLDHNTGIEMAELQIWAGKTLDTNDVGNRRLFIARNETGAKVPVLPKVAAQRLGRPHVLLHGSSNWKQGRNTGSTGRTTEGEIIPSGQFAHIGGIEKFKPDPKLGR